MEIVFDSKTGNVRRFIESLKLPEEVPVTMIEPGLHIRNPFILVTYTTGFGNVPATTLDFLKSNHINLKAVAASGNLVWGNNFARSADIICDMYGVPILMKFEMSGMPDDVETFKERVQNIRYETHRTK